MKIFVKYYFVFSFLSITFLYGNELTLNEKKMRKLASELRCVVCQNQSLLESDSEIAKDLKNLILEMYMKGNDASEIKSFLVDRYGEFILFKPKLNKKNLVLWLAPLISIIIVSVLALRNLNFSKRKK